MQDKNTEYKITRRVTIIGGILDTVLACAKILVGVIGQSQALVADGIHSLSDLATDVMVILAARHASREADDDHPYGHHRIETVASVVLALLLALVALGICWDSVTRMLSGEPLPVPSLITLVVASFSALSKEGIYHYTMRAANRIDSKLLRANAWHSRSDALSSLVVMIGLAGALAGYPVADALAAIVVSVMILKVAWDIGKTGVDELIDTGLDRSELQQIRQSVLDVPGVKDMHDLRTRRMGSSIFCDLHVHVPSRISVSEGHRIGEEVYKRMKAVIERLDDIVVHIDAEDDTESRPSSHLPLRDEIEPEIRRRCDEILGHRDSVEQLTLHYIAGQIQAGVRLSRDSVKDAAAETLESLRMELGNMEPLGSITLLTRL